MIGVDVGLQGIGRGDISGGLRVPSRCHTLVAVLLAAVFSLVGCSGSAKRNDANGEPGPSSVPPELASCVSGGDAAPTAECRERLYVESVRTGDFPELADLDDDRLVAFGNGLCSYAESLRSTDPAARPMFGDLVSSTSSSWGVGPAVMEAVYASTKQLCPAGFDLLRTLRRSESSIQVELSVVGTGSANITYFLPGGTPTQETAESLPWKRVIHQSEPDSISLSVAPIRDGTVGCSIAVGDVVVDEQRVAAEPATCDADAQAVDRAVVKDGHGG